MRVPRIDLKQQLYTVVMEHIIIRESEVNDSSQRRYKTSLLVTEEYIGLFPGLGLKSTVRSSPSRHTMECLLNE